MDKEQEMKNLIQKRDAITTRFFWLALKIALIIGIPAFVAAYFGKKLDIAKDTDMAFTIGFLVIAFVFSWIIIYFQYKKISKQVKDVEDKIKTLRSEITK